jgi:OmpA-OmpF porin, OOP family
VFRTRTAASGGRDLPRQAEQQDPTANAAAFQAGLAQNGHVEVPGGFFDTGKSDIEPEWEPALKEVVKLLQDNLNLKVWVVSHTDNTGSEETNVNLFQARAAAVVMVLSEKMGVAGSRLAPHGAGPYASIAESTTDAGRAKNRRVGLVKRSQ